MTLDYSGACIVQKPIYPHLCQFRDYDIQTLSEYVMTYYVVSLKVLCLQIEIEIAMHGNSMFSYCKNV